MESRKMGMIRGMMAASLDGFAADAGGGVGWLDAFEGADWGYDAFIAEIGTVVMGRLTYRHMLDLTPDWPYPGKRGIVVGRGLQSPLRGGAEVWPGDLPALVAHLRAGPMDAWIVGGPMLQGAFLRMGALDRLQLCVVPRLLGTGLPVFPAGPMPSRQPRLQSASALPMGMVMLDYLFEA
jgi:dihydrofolate reductase